MRQLIHDKDSDFQKNIAYFAYQSRRQIVISMTIEWDSLGRQRRLRFSLQQNHFWHETLALFSVSQLDYRIEHKKEDKSWKLFTQK